MWDDLGFRYFHLHKGVPKQYVGRVSLVYKDLLDYAIGYLNTDNHGVILYWVNCFEVICCESYKWHFRYSVPRDHVDGSDLLKVLFSRGGGGPSLTKPQAMVFMTHLGWSRGFSFLSLKQLQLLSLFDQPACSRSLSQLDFGRVLPSGLYDCGLWMNSFSWPSLMSSSILSFKSLHSSVEWLRLWWYW